MRERIREWKPWERSTGPRTSEGKARAARNSDKGGMRPLIRKMARHFRECFDKEKNHLEDLVQ
jgi:hypothetical protein